jgi:hypothetical protein
VADKRRLLRQDRRQEEKGKRRRGRREVLRRMSKVNRVIIVLLLVILLVGSVNAKKSKSIVVSTWGRDARIYYDYDTNMWYENDVWPNRDDPIIDNKVVALSFLEGKNYEEGIEALANSGREYLVIDWKKYYLSNLQQRKEFEEKALSYSLKPEQKKVQELKKKQVETELKKVEETTEQIERYKWEGRMLVRDDEGTLDAEGEPIGDVKKEETKPDTPAEKGVLVWIHGTGLGESKDGKVRVGDTVIVDNEKWEVLDEWTLQNRKNKEKIVRYNDDFGSYEIKQGDKTLKEVKKDGKGKTISEILNTYGKDKDGKLSNQQFSVIRNYLDEDNYETRIIYKDGKETEKIVTNKRGEPQSVYAYKNGRWVEDEERLTTIQNQYKSRKFFADAEFVLTQFSGLAGYSKLFFSEEALYNWRESVDELFASMYLGTEYWTSGICSTYTDKVGDGTMLMETPYGMLEPAAHVEGERSEIITYINESGEPKKEYFYKLSFAVDNPDNSRQDMDFNVLLYGERTVRMYRNSIDVKEGGSFRRIGNTMIVQYSNYLYNKICIKFDRKIRVGGESVKKLCNTITKSSAPITRYEAKKAEAEQRGGGEVEEQEADF